MPHHEVSAGGPRLRSGLVIRPFTPADDLGAELDLRQRSFGLVADTARWTASMRHSIEAGQVVGVFDGSRLVASARYYPMTQWWHGRPLQMAGVAGVKVAPEERGTGIGRAMMTVLIGDLARHGFPISVLYPTTAPLYRALGWEPAGGRYKTVLPAAALATLLPPDPLAAGQPGRAAPGNGWPAGAGGSGGPPSVRRATAADAATVVATIDRVHQSLGDCGPSTHLPDVVAAWLGDDTLFAHLASDGFLAYRWADGTDKLVVEYLAAASAPTVRRLWQIVASHGQLAKSVHAYLAPDDLIGRLTREPAAMPQLEVAWMLRVLDPVAAIEARGYPSAACVSVQLELADEILPQGAGRWQFEVAGGSGTLTAAPAGGPGPAIRLGSRGFAALFAGVPVRMLRLAGLAAGGDPAADEQLAGAFGGRPPFMMFEF